MAANLTETEIAKLDATTTKQEWNALVKQIMDSRDGGYPDDWFAVMILGGHLNRKMAEFNS